MFKEKLELHIKGEVIFKLNNNLLFKVDNAIQVEAKEIVSKRLIGDVSSVIDTIELYNVGGLVCSRPITNQVATNSTQVEFDAIFDKASFNGVFDEARLKASVIGNFSIVTGLSGVKDGDSQLMVSWLIQIV